jgi:tetratricopeptide (TPR) repeat protein
MEQSNSWLKTIWEDREKRLILGLCLFLVLSTAVVYLQTAGFEFVDYDDQGNIRDNPKVPGGLTWDGIKWAFTTMFGSNWFPLIWLSFMLDRTIFGTWAGGFHLVNVVLHIANTVLLFWVLKRYTKTLWASFFVAALFALHPLHVESVAWVTERKDVLSTLFWLLTMLAYLQYVESATFKRYVLICVLYALGLMTKPMLVTLPFVLLLMDYWPLKRLLPQAPNFMLGVNPQDKPGGLPVVSSRRLIFEKAPLFILSAASCVVTYVAQKTGGAVVRFGAITLGTRIENALISYCEYIVKMFKPIGLAVFYPHPVKGLAVGEIAASLAFLAAVTTAVVLLRKRRYLLVGWLWYMGTLVPVIGIVQVGGQAMADRYTYIPLTGIFIMLVWLFSDLTAQLQYRRIFAGLAGSVVLGVLGVMTFVQVSYWRDTMTLFQHAAAVTKDNFVAHSILGVRFAEKGDFKAAMHAFDIILKATPKDADTLYNVAKSLDVQGRTDEAIEYYKRVLSIVPDDPDAYNGLAVIQARQKNFERAIELYKEGLSKKPDDGGLHGGLGSLYLQMERVDEAIPELERGVKLKEDSSIYGNLGSAVLEKGDIDKAIEYLSKAIKLDNANAEAHFNLGNIYLSQGRLATAISEYEKAIKHKPKYVKAYSNLAVALAQMGKFNEAIEDFNRCVEIEPNSPDARFNLASALVDVERIDEAVENLRKAVELKPDDAGARALLGRLLLRQNRAEDAMAEFKQVLKTDPANAEAHYGLGNIYLAQNRLEEAAGEYEQVIQARPEYFEAYSNLAVALMRSGKLDEAIEKFRFAAAIEPDNPDVYFNMAGALSDKGKVDEAIETVRKAIELSPADTRARCRLAELLLRKGETLQATAEYEQVLRIEPSNQEAKTGLQKIKGAVIGGTDVNTTGQGGQSLMPRSSLVKSDSNM